MLALTGGLPAASAAGSVTSLRINEVESDGGSPGDWIELTNVGTSTVDASGVVLKDNDDSHALTLASGTSIASGGFLAVDVDARFGLGSSDSARLFAPGGSTLIDSYTWTAHASGTYGRCSNGVGAFEDTTPTKGKANTCPGTVVPLTWPGGTAVSNADKSGQYGENLSGLVYEGSGSSTPGTMWAVDNGPGTLYKLVKSGSNWVPASGSWAAGKALHYAGGSGDVDAEGVTITGAGSSGGVYVASERDNDNSKVSRPAIQRFDVSGSGTSLTPTNDWNLSADLPGLEANGGLESVAWVPDSYLTAGGFVDQRTGAAYVPSNYPNHGTGLFFTAVETTGRIYAYALDQTSNAYTRIASFDSGLGEVMDLNWEAQTSSLWVACDDNCDGRTARFGLDTHGAWSPLAYYNRPSGMSNYNNEGFATTPASECSNHVKPVYWSDDSDDGSHAIRVGTLTC